MSKRKILFVGDLRTAYNYGAIATTEALLDLVKTAAPNDEIQLIDRRSFKGTTPENGLPNIDVDKVLYQQSNSKKVLIEISKKLHVYNILRRLKTIIHSETQNADNIPDRFDKYLSFADEVLNGKTWRFEREKIKWADIIIINGEGNIVNGTDSDGRYRFGGRYILFFAFLSECVYHKPCYIINHTVDPKNSDIKEIIKKIYPQMTGIYVREKKSYALLKQWGINNIEYIPDALWSHDFKNDKKVKPPIIFEKMDFSKPYICIGDSSGISNNYSHVKWDIVKVYSKLINGLKEVCNQIVFIDGYSGKNEEINKVVHDNKILSVNLKTCNYHELYYVLSHAQLFISGRWHASIIALLGHTPILLWGSDSHKTEALYSEIGYNHEFFDVNALPINIDRVVEEAKKIIKEDHSKIWNQVEQLKSDSYQNVKMLKN